VGGSEDEFQGAVEAERARSSHASCAALSWSRPFFNLLFGLVGDDEGQVRDEAVDRGPGSISKCFGVNNGRACQRAWRGRNRAGLGLAAIVVVAEGVGGGGGGGGGG